MADRLQTDRAAGAGCFIDAMQCGKTTDTTNPSFPPLSLKETVPDMSMSPPLWHSIRDHKLAEQASRIPKEWLISLQNMPSSDVINVMDIPRTCGVLTPKELHITEAYDARTLATELRYGKLTAVEVTNAFCKRAAIAHQLTNCLTEPLFASALRRARYVDAQLARTGKPIGPLHGLPISVKDGFHIHGTDSSIGIAALAFHPADRNAALVELLLNAGAIIHCKTNVPQTLQALDSVNNIFGRTLNPRNRQEWSAGGSSGGEAVLVSMRGCVIGVGTDVGGSIRIPAMCNGVVGFKPSKGRVPYSGQESGQLPAAETLGLEASAGPIVRGLSDVEVFMEAVEAGKSWETDVGVLPGRWWTGQEAKKEMVIGVVWKDGVIEPLPPVRKVLEEVVGKLRKRGVQVVEVDAIRFKDCQALANKFFGAEGGNYMLDLLEKTEEPLIPWLRSRMKRGNPKSIDQFRDLQARKAELQADFLKIWRDVNGRTIDAFISPIAPHPVPPIDRWNGVSYTSSFVLLDYPAGTLPVRAVEKSDLAEEMNGEPLSSWDKVNRKLCMRDLILTVWMKNADLKKGTRKV